jgi:hypothetical protein
MTDERDDSSVRVPGGIHRPTTVLCRQRLPRTAGRGKLIRSLDTRDALPALESLHALDWLRSFLAALLMGLGPFVALYLADHGWVPANIGLVLTASALAGLLTQVPAGELIDMVQSKRALVGRLDHRSAER